MKQIYIRTTMLFTTLFYFLPIFAFSQTPADEAWKKIGEGKKEEAKVLFEQAIENSDTELRGRLGLFFLYEEMGKNKEAFEQFEEAMELTDDAPYYIASHLLSGIFKNRMIYPANESIEFVEKMYEKYKSNGYIAPELAEFLGIAYQLNKEPERSKEYYSTYNSIEQWNVIGPFENISGSGFDKVFPPETEFRFDAEYPGKDGIPVKWFTLKEIRNDKWIDYTRYFSSYYSSYFANSFVWSPEQRKVQLRIGTSGSLKAFLNDHLVISVREESNNGIDTYIIETELAKGWNRILVKVSCSEIFNINFLARITDPAGKSFDDLKYDSAEQDYNKSFSPTYKRIQLPFEKYFEDLIASNPDHPENYIFLSEIYSHNGQDEKSEELLLKGLDKFSNNTLFMLKLCQTYLTEKKTDEYNSLMEKINSIDDSIPKVMEKLLSDKILQKNVIAAEKLYNNYSKVVIDSPMKCLFEFQIAALKQDGQKIMESMETALKKYPYNADIASTCAIVYASGVKDFKKAMEILETYASKNNMDDVNFIIASIYLQSGDINKWESILLDIIENDPPAAGVYYQLAKQFFATQNYDKAEEYLNKGMEIAPFISTYYSLLGDIFKAKGKTESGIKYYDRALLYKPTDFISRDKRKELLGASENFNDHQENIIADLIKKAPQQKTYPEDDAIYILKDKRNIIFSGGASEERNDILIKVFNKNGIESFTQYYIPNNRLYQELVIDKAIVIKEDGSEIQADINGGELVFKSLDPNDCIHIKYKIRNMYAGSLARHFWDNYEFDDYYPVQLSRYGIISPKDFEFDYSTRNIDIKPEKSELGNNTYLHWEMKDLPAIKSEYGMPELFYLSKHLEVSSIKNWNYLAKWYKDISFSKPKVTHEIKSVVKDLFSGKENLSEEEKIEIIYTYVTENITYSSVSFRQSGQIPQKAQKVLSTKIGDCKDMATLAIAMLKEIGIKGEYVLVQTDDNLFKMTTLPSPDFNHVIVGVKTSTGKYKYMDMTARDFPFNTIPDPDINALSLLISDTTNSTFRIKKEDFLLSNGTRKYEMTLFTDNSANLEIKTKRTGAITAGMRINYRFKGEEEKLKELTESLSDDYSNFELLEFGHDNFNELSDTSHYLYKLKLKNYSIDAGNMKLIQLPWLFKFSSREGLSYKERTTPYCYPRYFDSRTDTLNCEIPKGYSILSIPQNSKMEDEIFDYSLESKSDGNKIEIIRKINYKNNIVPVEKYSNFKAYYEKVLKADSQQIVIQQN